METATPISELEAARAEAVKARQRADAQEAELAKATRAGAERAIEDAVRRGAIPPLHRKLRAAWLAACLKDSNIIDLLAMQPGRALSEQRRGDSLIHPRPTTLIVAEEQDTAEPCAAVDPRLPAYSFEA